MHLIVEGRFNLASIRMGADKNPSILFFKLATLYHAYSNIHHHLSDIGMIGVIFAIAMEKYSATLNMTVDNQGAALQLSHFQKWRQQRVKYLKERE